HIFGIDHLCLARQVGDQMGIRWTEDAERFFPCGVYHAAFRQADHLIRLQQTTMQGDTSTSLEHTEIFPLFTVDEQNRIPGLECGAISHRHSCSALGNPPVVCKETRAYRERPRPTRTLDRGSHDTVFSPSLAAHR